MKTVNGAILRKMFNGGLVTLDANKDYIDSLNVFPVPDGDTGINMFLTMKSVLKEVESTHGNELGVIASAVSKGGLKGARGNSGVILSQILKGMMAELAKEDSRGKAPREVTTKQFAKAIENGAKVAYSAVTVPKEGTMLTVIRVMGEDAKKIAKSESDFDKFFEKLMQAGETILQQTPEMLPPLKKAGVVDSGGRGILVIFGGMQSALGDTDIKFDFSKDGSLEGNDHTPHAAQLEDLGDIEFAYCTEFNITNMHKTTTMASIDDLRERLMQMGDSVVCVGDLDMVKVHVHTNTPGEAITAGLMLGEMINLKIDNMLQQNRDFLASQNVEEKEQGIVSVAAGEGMISLFKEMGVDFVIKGGQTMNPSAEDIATAADRIHARNVFVFPNNKNIILAARHAQDLSKKNLIIIPTTSVQEGLSAVVAFADEASVEENTQSFNEAAANVRSGSVTYAVRNTQLSRFKIKEGEILGLDQKGVVATGTSIPEVTTKLVAKMVKPDTSIVTLFHGEGVKEKDAHELHDKLMKKYPETEVSMINGGQPVYYYLVSVE
ncbi:MAG: DAK2 domain-containing protein [Firmicutes bacterium]|nr:DAK2 domain-containing protein [Bacillota bacterium]